MAVDILALSGFIIAILGGLAHFIKETHVQKCNMCCIDSDCRQKKIPSTPNSRSSMDEQPKHQHHHHTKENKENKELEIEATEI